MKRFTKISLTISLILVTIGITICIIGVIGGGWQQINEIDGGRWKDGINIITDYQFAEAVRGGKEKQELSDAVTEELTAEDVREMDVSIGGAFLYVEESQNESFEFRTEGKGEYSCYKSGGVLYVEGKTIGNSKDCIYLTIPKEIVFDEVTMDIGAGFVQLSAITADEIGIHIGAGKLEADGMNGKSLILDTGAGQAELKNVEAEELDIDIGMGECRIQGNVTEEISIECGMGRTELKLAGKEEDFDYEISCAAGNVAVGNKNYSGLGEDTYIDNDASKKCTVECAMGSTDISFE